MRENAHGWIAKVHRCVLIDVDSLWRGWESIRAVHQQRTDAARGLQWRRTFPRFNWLKAQLTYARRQVDSSKCSSELMTSL